MSRDIAWMPRSRRDLRAMHPDAARRVILAVDRFADTGQGDVKRLQGIVPPEWRLRVGPWRVRYGIDAGKRTIIVYRVLPRSSAYRD